MTGAQVYRELLICNKYAYVIPLGTVYTKILSVSSYVKTPKPGLNLFPEFCHNLGYVNFIKALLNQTF